MDLILAVVEMVEMGLKSRCGHILNCLPACGSGGKTTSVSFQEKDQWSDLPACSRGNAHRGTHISVHGPTLGRVPSIMLREASRDSLIDSWCSTIAGATLQVLAGPQRMSREESCKLRRGGGIQTCLHLTFRMPKSAS